MKKLVVAAALCVAVLPRMAMGATVALEHDFAPLSPGVRAVDYIESDGTQYIDTGVRMTSQMGVELDFAFAGESLDTSKDQGLFGLREGGGVEFYFYQGSQLTVQYPACTRFKVSLDKVSVGKRYRLIMRPDRKDILSDGVSVGSQVDTPGRALAVAGRTAYVFGANADGISGVPMRLYGLRIRNEVTGEIVRHFVPCVKENVAGLYDGVTGGFFGPQYSDGGAAQNAFVCGDYIEDDSNVMKWREIACVSVSGLEDGESCLVKTVSTSVEQETDDYLESDGTQSIDFGFAITENMTVDLDFAPLRRTGDDARDAYFGTRTGKSACVYQNINGVVVAESGSTACRASASNWSIGQRIVAHLENGLAGLTDVASGCGLAETSAAAGFGTESNIHLFDAPGYPGVMGMMRFYSLTISEKGAGGAVTIVHRFVPAVQDGVVGVIDKVGDAGFSAPTNAAANPLLYGFQTYGSKMWKEVPEVAVGDPYLQSGGTQYVDLGFKLTPDMTIDLDFSPLEVPTANLGFFGSRASGAQKSIQVISVAPNLCIDLNYESTSSGAYRLKASEWTLGHRFVAHIQRHDVSFTDMDTSTVIATMDASVADGDYETLNAYLFGSNAFGGYAKMKFYSLKIVKGGEVVCHFVPHVQDGVAGIYDIEGDKGFIAPKGTGALLYCAETTRLPLHAVTNVFEVAENGLMTLTAENLKPGISYEDDVFVGDVRLGGSYFLSPKELWPNGSGRLGLELTDMPAQGKLGVTLMRIGAAAETVSVVYGTKDCGGDLTKWEGQKTLPKGFAAGVQTLTANVSLPANAVFVRFVTSGGAWSSTVYLPETSFVPRKGGLAIIVR